MNLKNNDLKIGCSCGNIIVDQTDYLKYKAYLISDSEWFNFWDSIDEARKDSNHEQQNIQLEKQKLFKTLWECNGCGRLFFENGDKDIISYVPENCTYNKILE